VRMGMLEMVVPAGMVKVTVLSALHGDGVVVPAGQTLMLPKFMAWAEAGVVVDAKAPRQMRVAEAAVAMWALLEVRVRRVRTRSRMALMRRLGWFMGTSPAAESVADREEFRRRLLWGKLPSVRRAIRLILR